MRKPEIRHSSKSKGTAPKIKLLQGLISNKNKELRYIKTKLKTLSNPKGKQWTTN